MKVKRTISILSICFLFSCNKSTIEPSKREKYIGSNHINYHYGYTILANTDTSNTGSKK